MDKRPPEGHNPHVAERPLPLNVRRHVQMDNRGTGLRVTWHPEEALSVLSLWREDRCVGTFQATPSEMAALIGFLASALAQTAEQPAQTTPLTA